MELMRNWIISVTVAAMIIALAESMMPEGTVKKIGKLTGGLVLMLGILQPIVRMDYEDLFLAANGFPSVTIESQGAEAEAELLKSIIEEELAAYVLDKAQELGCHCEVRVRCAMAETVGPVPEDIELRGRFTPQQQKTLQQYIVADLGIPLEKQRYLDEDVT